MLIVILASGPDKGQVHEFSDNESVVLGRTTGPIQFTDTKISRQHVKLWCEGGQWFVRDLESRHGSWRNNKPVSGPRTQLKDGDRLQIGRTVLVVSRVPVEQAKKLELLADPANAPIELPEDRSERSLSITSVRRRRSRRPLRDFAWGLAAAAAIALVGLNLFMLMEARRQNAALRDQLARTPVIAAAPSGSLAADPDTNRLLQDVLALVKDTPTREQLDAAVKQIEGVRTADTRRQELLESILAEVKAGQAADPQAAAKLDEVLAAVKDQPKLTEALVQEQLAQFDESRHVQEKMLRELFAAVQAQPEQINMVRKELVEAIRGQPDAEQAAAKLAQKLEEELAALRSAVASQPEPTRKLMEEVASKLAAMEARPDAAPDPRLDEVLAAVKREPRDIEPMLRDLLAKLEGQEAALAALQLTPTRDQMVKAIESAVAELPARQAEAMRAVLSEVTAKGDPADDAVLREILQSVREQPTKEQLSAAIDAAMKVQAEDRVSGERMLRDVLAAVENQPTKEALAAAVEAKIAEQRETSDSLLRMLHDEIKRRPTQEEIARALEETVTAKLTPRDEMLKEILAAATAKPDPGQQQVLADLLAAVQAQPQQTQAMIEKVLTRLDEPVHSRRDPVLDEVLAAVKREPKDLEPMLRELASKLDDDEARRADEANAAMLREIAAAVKTQPVETKQLVDQVLARLEQPADAANEAMLKEVLAAIKEREALEASSGQATAMGGDRHEQLLRQVLAEIRSRQEPIAQAVLDGLRGELREQVTLAMAQAQAANAASVSASRPVASPAADATARRDAAPANVSIYPNADPLARFDPQRGAAATPGPARPGEVGLTDTQLAYKRAWENGLPEVVGGRLDPVTGARIDGRTLDPTRARAMGISRWQDWYMIDDYAEQERLRQAATQFAAAKPSPLTTPLYQLASPQGNRNASASVAVTTPRRVVFILDASASIAPALPVALDRLVEMIDALADDDAFTLLVYQEKQVSEVPPRGLKPATPKAAEHAVNWLQPGSGNLRPSGHANPIGALQQALLLKPDDIYLISARVCGDRGEAVTPADLMAGIEHLARDPRTRLHTVEVFNADPQNTLRRLAEQYGGTYQMIADPNQAVIAPGGANARIE